MGGDLEAFFTLATGTDNTPDLLCFRSSTGDHLTVQRYLSNTTYLLDKIADGTQLVRAGVLGLPR